MLLSPVFPVSHFKQHSGLALAGMSPELHGCMKTLKMHHDEGFCTPVLVFEFIIDLLLPGIIGLQPTANSYSSPVNSDDKGNILVPIRKPSVVPYVFDYSPDISLALAVAIS